MTERELREKLQSAYGTMPDATRAAFEHSLTHHRVETRHPARMSRRMRTIVTLALMLMMLTAVGVAAAKLASVTDYPPPSGLTPEYMSHLVTLNEAYDGDLLTLSVNDLVFDGTTVDVAMNVQPKAGKQVFMDMQVTAECEGQTYALEIEGCGGGDFMSGMFLPDETDSWSDSPFAFDGVLWDDDMQSPPEGVPIAWTMTFELLQPVWEVEYLPDAQYQALLAGGADTLEAYVQNNWRKHIIPVTYAVWWSISMRRRRRCWRMEPLPSRFRAAGRNSCFPAADSGARTQSSCSSQRILRMITRIRSWSASASAWGTTTL